MLYKYEAGLHRDGQHKQAGSRGTWQAGPKRRREVGSKRYGVGGMRYGVWGME